MGVLEGEWSSKWLIGLRLSFYNSPTHVQTNLFKLIKINRTFMPKTTHHLTREKEKKKGENVQRDVSMTSY
jgi:hypothetical protein